jgi:hypothetical protein
MFMLSVSAVDFHGINCRLEEITFIYHAIYHCSVVHSEFKLFFMYRNDWEPFVFEARERSINIVWRLIRPCLLSTQVDGGTLIMFTVEPWFEY